jgi:CDP-paratose 2-epimerase
MKILVTGGCGFLGSHVCEFFRKAGDEVIAYDNLTKSELIRTGYPVTGARNYNSDILRQMGVAIQNNDIRDLDILMDTAKDADFIIHTAAQPAMTIAIEEPIRDHDVNVHGTLNVLEAARRYDIPVVNCSSIHVYGTSINDTLTEEVTGFQRHPPDISEQHPIMTGVLSPLHASKRSGELYVQAYTDTYGLKAATFRLSGMYGPRQFGGEDHGWVANFAIRSILGLPIRIFGTDKQVRDILYASDAVQAFDAFLKNQEPGIYNIGGGLDAAISIKECLDQIAEISGKKQSISLEPARHGDLWYFVSDIRKARKQLGWEPQVRPHAGIEKLVFWIESNLHLFGA